MGLQQSILQLNDDCLYMIFSQLALYDLCSIGSTCKRLNQIASCFYNHYTHLDVSMFSKNQTKFNLINERQMEMIIKQIGSFVKSFHADYSFSDYCDVEYPAEIESLIKLIIKYCCNISELKLSYITDDAVLLEIMQHENIRHLETIDITTSIRDNALKGDEILKLLAKLPKLKNLNFDCRNELLNTQLFKNFKNLETFATGYIQIKIDVWREIFLNNPLLKTLEIWTSCSLELFNLIIDQLVWIERLMLRMLRSEILLSRITQLKCLKHLKLNDCSVLLNLEKIAEFDQLESLDLNGSDFDMQILAKFTNLKHLAANSFNNNTLNSLGCKATLENIDIIKSHNVTDDGLLTFVSDAKKLCNLSICECYGLNGSFINQLNNLLASQNRKLTLYSDIHDGYDKSDVKHINILQTKYGRYEQDDFVDD